MSLNGQLAKRVTQLRCHCICHGFEEQTESIIRCLRQLDVSRVITMNPSWLKLRSSLIDFNHAGRLQLAACPGLPGQKPRELSIRCLPMESRLKIHSTRQADFYLTHMMCCLHLVSQVRSRLGIGHGRSSQNQSRIMNQSVHEVMPSIFRCSSKTSAEKV